MEKQINRLSAHQNGKVFGILLALITLPFLIPMFFMMNFAMPHMNHSGGPNGFSAMFLFVAPIIYLIIGYITVAIFCLLYNVVQRFVGGFEFEVSDSSSEK